ncbi:response regulator [Rhizobium sp. RM]|uniref:response regulator n=1 Tax=Rhizobium sp. RM TaxID=2748079 RepID=UPI00110F2C92|nr:response regulator [Rhizobium sp. RM]NWJ27506.1 response regulator [Rhizobium sp. RM]TMV20030.1 response regulator [Rhizobium sp. Td3]
MYQSTVLIVEDEPLLRMVLADTLLGEGFDVVETANVLEAIAVLGQTKIDAVITDIDMPGGLSGLDLAKMISTARMTIPTIIVSGRHVLRNEDVPGDAIFIPKPYSMDAVVELITSMTQAEINRIAK